MSLLSKAIQSDSGIAVAAKYLVLKIGPFFEMPLTGDTDKVRDFKLGRVIGELDALIYRITPSPSNTQRMRFLANQLLDFAFEAGVPIGSDESFVNWVEKNGTLEDKVMETVFEIDYFLDQAYTMVSGEIQRLGKIRKNLLVNFNILQDIAQTMMLGGPGSDEELDAFEQAVNGNLANARRILANFDFY